MDKTKQKDEGYHMTLRTEESWNYAGTSLSGTILKICLMTSSEAE